MYLLLVEFLKRILSCIFGTGFDFIGEFIAIKLEDECVRLSQLRLSLCGTKSYLVQCGSNHCEKQKTKTKQSFWTSVVKKYDQCRRSFNVALNYTVCVVVHEVLLSFF